MDLKLFVVASLLLAATSAVGYSRDVWGPTEVNDGQSNRSVASASATIDISAENPAPMVSGTCSVAQSSALLPPLNGDFSFTCGVDRDDDTFVTTADLGGSTDADGYDDDFASSGVVAGPNGAGSVSVCFRKDTLTAGDLFDDMVVFVAMNVPTTSVAVGTFRIDVSLAWGSSCTPSAHEAA